MLSLQEVVEQSAEVVARDGDSEMGEAAPMPSVVTAEDEVIKMSCYTVRNCGDAECELATHLTVIYSTWLDDSNCL